MIKGTDKKCSLCPDNLYTITAEKSTNVYSILFYFMLTLMPSFVSPRPHSLLPSIKTYPPPPQLEDSHHDAGHNCKDSTSRAESCHLHHACFHGNTTPHSRHGHCHQQPPETRRQFRLPEHTNQSSGGQQATQSGHRRRHTNCVQECYCRECESLLRFLPLHIVFPFNLIITILN